MEESRSAGNTLSVMIQKEGTSSKRKPKEYRFKSNADMQNFIRCIRGIVKHGALLRKIFRGCDRASAEEISQNISNINVSIDAVRNFASKTYQNAGETMGSDGSRYGMSQVFEIILHIYDAQGKGGTFTELPNYFIHGEAEIFPTSDCSLKAWGVPKGNIAEVYIHGIFHTWD